MADMTMRRLFADAIEEIIDPETGIVAGLVYEWNTGERRKQWVGAKLKKFALRPIDHQPPSVLDQTEPCSCAGTGCKSDLRAGRGAESHTADAH